MLPSRNQKRFIIGTLSVLAVTGLTWTYLDLTQNSRSVADTKQLILSVHAAFGFLMILIFGGLINQHVAPMIRSGNHKRRSSGITLLAMISMQILTVYVLYYGAETFREGAEILHLFLGIFLVTMLSIHLRPRS